MSYVYNKWIKRAINESLFEMVVYKMTLTVWDFKPITYGQCIRVYLSYSRRMRQDVLTAMHWYL